MSTSKLQQKVSTLGEQVKQEASEISKLGTTAITSYGWLYPIKGAVYFVSHPNLYRAVKDKLWSCFLLSVGTVVGMFVFTYFPQAAVMSLFSGPLGFIAAIPLVLTESFLIITFVSRLFLIDPALEDLFDAVLVEQGQIELVQRGREVTKGRSGMSKLGKKLSKPLERFSFATLARYIVMLPLNAIPGVGTGIFLLYNGRKSGPGWHARYFQLKGIKGSEKETFIQKNQAAYTAFGALSLALNLIPFVGILSAFTTTVGAAIWAADIEKGNRKPGDTTAPEQGTQVSFGDELKEGEREGKKEL